VVLINIIVGMTQAGA